MIYCFIVALRDPLEGSGISVIGSAQICPDMPGSLNKSCSQDRLTKSFLSAEVL